MKKRILQALSPSETEILRLVWRLGEATVQQVADTLPANRTIKYATVQTLLRRLEKKGYTKHRLNGKAHVFYPVAKKEDVIQRSVTDFVDKLFGGNPIPLMHYLAEHGELTEKDIENLKKIVTNQ